MGRKRGGDHGRARRLAERARAGAACGQRRGGLIHRAGHDAGRGRQSQRFRHLRQNRPHNAAARKRLRQARPVKLCQRERLVPVIVALQVKIPGGGQQRFFRDCPAREPKHQIILQQEEFVGPRPALRLLLAKPEQLRQRQRAAQLRQAGALVKALPVKRGGKPRRLRLRPAVQPDDRGPQGLSLPVHAEQRFALRRQRDGTDPRPRFGGQRQNALCCRIQINLRLCLGAHTARLQSIFPARQRRLPELTVKQAGFYGRRADVQRQNQFHICIPHSRISVRQFVSAERFAARQHAALRRPPRRSDDGVPPASRFIKSCASRRSPPK